MSALLLRRQWQLFALGWCGYVQEWLGGTKAAPLLPLAALSARMSLTEDAVGVPHGLVLSVAVWFGSICRFDGLSLPLLLCPVCGLLGEGDFV